MFKYTDMKKLHFSILILSLSFFAYSQDCGKNISYYYDDFENTKQVQGIKPIEQYLTMEGFTFNIMNHSNFGLVLVIKQDFQKTITNFDKVAIKTATGAVLELTATNSETNFNNNTMDWSTAGYFNLSSAQLDLIKKASKVKFYFKSLEGLDTRAHNLAPATSQKINTLIDCLKYASDLKGINF
jgi:hypothetical protein